MFLTTFECVMTGFTAFWYPDSAVTAGSPFGKRYPSHLFYVKIKGRVNAESLIMNDQCTSFKGKDIVFASREEPYFPQMVYNLEIKEQHTYFTGSTRSR